MPLNQGREEVARWSIGDSATFRHQSNPDAVVSLGCHLENGEHDKCHHRLRAVACDEEEDQGQPIVADDSGLKTADSQMRFT
jgi:hypothetical protein